MPSAWVRFDIRQIGRKIAVVLVLWLVLNVAFTAFFVRPRLQEFRNLEEESRPRLEALAERKIEVEEREAFLAALAQAEADLASLRNDWLGTRGRQMVPIQLELSRLAEQFHINLEHVQYNNSNLEEEGLERMAMVVPLEAGYSNLRRFLQAVETSSRFLVIERVALGQGQDGGVLLQLNITLATYFDAPHLQQRLDEERRDERRRGRAAAREKT